MATSFWGSAFDVKLLADGHALPIAHFCFAGRRSHFA